MDSHTRVEALCLFCIAREHVCQHDIVIGNVYSLLPEANFNHDGGCKLLLNFDKLTHGR